MRLSNQTTQPVSGYVCGNNLATKDDLANNKVNVFPDWEHGIKLPYFPTSNNTWTAPCDGWYVVNFITKSGNSFLYINGVKTAFFSENASSNRCGGKASFVLLKTGDVIYWDATQDANAILSNDTNILYPLK